MKTILGWAMLIAGSAGFAMAVAAAAPEIDGGSAVAAVALLAGGLVVLRGRRRK